MGDLSLRVFTNIRIPDVYRADFALVRKPNAWMPKNKCDDNYDNAKQVHVHEFLFNHTLIEEIIYNDKIILFILDNTWPFGTGHFPL